MNESVTLKDKIKSMFASENLSKVLSVASIVILILIFTGINPSFLVSRNITNILEAMSPLLVMACGVAFVLMLGSIDLSIGAVVSFSAVMLTVLFDVVGPTAYIFVVLYGIFAGLLNGVIHTYLKIPSFIATLCTLSVWQSAALILSGAQPLPIFPPMWPYIDWFRIRFGVVPVIFLIALAFMAIYSLINAKTKQGRTVLASGSSEKAARLIGLNIPKAKMIAFTLSGLAASVAGIMFAAMLKSGIPTVGAQYTLMAVASAALGGVALSGGRGAIPMTVIGAMLITIIQNGMNVIAVDGYWQQIVFGALVLTAIFMNSNRSLRNLIVK